MQIIISNILNILRLNKTNFRFLNLGLPARKASDLLIARLKAFPVSEICIIGQSSSHMFRTIFIKDFRWNYSVLGDLSSNSDTSLKLQGTQYINGITSTINLGQTRFYTLMISFILFYFVLFYLKLTFVITEPSFSNSSS